MTMNRLKIPGRSSLLQRDAVTRITYRLVTADGAMEMSHGAHGQIAMTSTITARNPHCLGSKSVQQTWPPRQTFP
jgi:hypothetical protein